MARLINPDTGTVVSCGDDLAALYLTLGWSEADQQDAATPDKPKTPARRARRTPTE